MTWDSRVSPWLTGACSSRRCCPSRAPGWPSPAASASRAAQGGFDNNDPRAWLARQTDWQARANAAQANSFEALPFFIGAVIIAHQLGAPQTRLDILALLFVTLRMIYIAMYVAGLPTRALGDLGCRLAGEHRHPVQRLPLIAPPAGFARYVKTRTGCSRCGAQQCAG